MLGSKALIVSTNFIKSVLSPAIISNPLIALFNLSKVVSTCSWVASSLAKIDSASANAVTNSSLASGIAAFNCSSVISLAISIAPCKASLLTPSSTSTSLP